MNPLSHTRLRPPRLFYGWWIVLASLPISIYTAGAFFYGFTALFDPIIREFGWSRAATSVAFTVQRGESGIAAPVIGVLTDRFGPRRVVFTGGVIIGLGFIFLAHIHSLWQFYLAFVIIAMGASACSPIVAYITTAQWFIRKRGRAFSILAAGAGLSGFMVYVLVEAIDAFGWRDAVQTIGIGMWFVVLPLALLYRHKPQQYGMNPDGDSDAMVQHAAESGKAERSLGIREALGSRAFWTLGIVFSLWAFVHAGVISQLISAVTINDQVTRSMAGIAGALTPLFSVVGRLGLGSLSDFMDKRLVIVMGLVIQAIGVIAFMILFHPWMVVVGSLFYGVGFGGFIPVRGAMQADLFGPNNFGAIQGGLQLLAMFGGVAGPVLAGWIADMQHSYAPAFYLFAAVLALSVPLILTLRVPPREHAEPYA